MRNPNPLEIRHVTERVQVIGLAQPLLPHVDQADPFQLASERVDPAQTDGYWRVLPDVSVDEQ